MHQHEASLATAGETRHPMAESPIPVEPHHRFRFDCTLCGACCFATVQLYPLDVRRLLLDAEACRVHGCATLVELVEQGWVRFVQDEETGVPVAFLGQVGDNPRRPCRFLQLQEEGGTPLLHPEEETPIYHCLLHPTGAKPTICRAMPVERYATRRGEALRPHLRRPAPDCPALERGAALSVGQWLREQGLTDAYSHADEFLYWTFWLARQPVPPTQWPEENLQILLRLWYDPALGSWEEAVARTPHLV